MREYPEETIRLNVDVPKSLNDDINSLLPHGTKAEVVRALLRMLLRDLSTPGGIIVIEGLIHDTASIQYDPTIERRG